MHIYIIELGHHSHDWFRKWLGACLAPSHYLIQWWPCLLTHDQTWSSWLAKLTHACYIRLYFSNGAFLFPVWYFSILKPEEHGGCFTNYRLKCIFLNEYFGILISISPKFVTECPVGSKSALVLVMTWQHQAISSTNVDLVQWYHMASTWASHFTLPWPRDTVLCCLWCIDAM